MNQMSNNLSKSLRKNLRLKFLEVTRVTKMWEHSKSDIDDSFTE